MTASDSKKSQKKGRTDRWGLRSSGQTPSYTQNDTETAPIEDVSLPILGIGGYLRRSTHLQYGSLAAQADWVVRTANEIRETIEKTGEFMGRRYSGVRLTTYYRESESSSDEIYFEPGTALFDFIESVRLGHTQVALVAVIDRLFRQAKREDVRGAILKHFGDAKVLLWAKDFKFLADRNSSEWQLLPSILGIFASSEQNTIKQRTLSQKKRKLKAGENQNFPTPPFGISVEYNHHATKPEERYVYARVPSETITAMEIYRLALGIKVRHIPEEVLARHFKDGIQEGQPIGDQAIAMIMNEAARIEGYEYLSKANYSRRLAETRLGYRSRRKERGDPLKNENEIIEIESLFDKFNVKTSGGQS